MSEQVKKSVNSADRYYEANGIDKGGESSAKVVQAYLEKAAKKDPILASRFDASKMDKCWEFISGCAKKFLHSARGSVSDAVVFKWARDYFLDGYAAEDAGLPNPGPAPKLEVVPKETSTGLDFFEAAGVRV